MINKQLKTIQKQEKQIKKSKIKKTATKRKRKIRQCCAVKRQCK